MKQFRIILLSLFVLIACKEVFDPPPQSLMEVSVKYSDSKQTGYPKISAYGVDMDSIWIYQEQTNLIRLPLSRKDTTAFVLLFDSIPDTLTIYHSTTLNYESMESGFFTEYWIKKIEHSQNRIDSVIMKDSAVNQFWHENIKLYINNLPADAN